MHGQQNLKNDPLS